MTTLVIDRGTLPEPVAALFNTPRIKIQQRQDGGKATLSPVVCADDYDNIDDYIDAVPGLREEILTGMTAPDSEFVDVPDDWIDRGV